MFNQIGSTIKGLFNPKSNYSSLSNSFNQQTTPTSSRYGSTAPVGQAGGMDFAKPQTTPGMINNASHPTAPTGQVQSHTVVTDPASGKSTTTQKYATPLAPDDPSHMYNTATGEKNPNYKDPNAPSQDPGAPEGMMYDGFGKLVPKVSSDALTNAQTLSNTGQQTDWEKQASGALTEAGQMTPQERIASDKLASEQRILDRYKNVAALSPYAETSMYTDRARTPEEVLALEQAPDLAGRASSTKGLLDSISNIYGTANVNAATGQLQNAQTAAGRGLSAAGTNLGAAQGQAGRAQGVAGTVFGSSLVSPTTQGQGSFSGLGGYQGSGGYFGDPNDPQTAINKQAFDALGSQTAALIPQLKTFNDNSSVLQSAASQSGVASNVPFVNAMGKKFGTAVMSNPSVIAFQTMSKILTDAGYSVPENASLDSIKSAMEQYKTSLNNTIAENQKQMDSLKKPSSSGGSTGGSIGWGDL